jgi:protein TonB
MQLFLKPFYSVDGADAPVDSTKDWQCMVLSFAAHALLLSIAIFCLPVSVLHQKDSPKEEIIMVTMESLPLDGSMASASVTQSMASAAAPQAAAPAPAPLPESKAVENFKTAKRDVAPVRPKPVSIKPPDPETAAQIHPKPASSPEILTQAAIAPENPPIAAGIASLDAEVSGSGAGSSEKGNHSVDGAGFRHGQGAGTGDGSGMGSGSGESAFGSAGGPGFIHQELPHFPRRAQAQGKEGTVVLRLTVDHMGRLSHVAVASSAGNGFDEEAIRAIQKSTFSPAVRNGRPVNCVALLSVRFQLE